MKLAGIPWDNYFRLLAAAGVPVTVEGRLQFFHFLTHCPPQTPAELAQVAQQIFGKSPAAQKVVADTFERWWSATIQTLDRELGPTFVAPNLDFVPSVVQPTWRRRYEQAQAYWRTRTRGEKRITVAVGLSFVAVLLYFGLNTAIPPPEPLPPGPIPTASVATSTTSPPPIETATVAAPRTFLASVPQITVTTHPIHRWVVGLVYIFLLGAVGVLELRRRKLWRPTPLGPESNSGPKLTPVVAQGAAGQFLRGRERAFLAWSVESYWTDQLTSALDLERTVAATAANGGIPSLHFLREKQLKKVWIWQEFTGNPLVARFGQELAAGMAEAGVNAQLAWVEAVPLVVSNLAHRALAAGDWQNDRETALVYWLTTGEDLLAAARDLSQKPGLERSLRYLAGWRGLTIVNLGDQHQALLALLAPYGLTAVLPGALGRPQPGPARSAQPWRAVLALGPGVVPWPTALALRHRLNLGPDAGALFGLQTESTSPQSWRPPLENKIESLGWLLRAYTHPTHPGSLLQRAVQVWLELYDEAQKINQSNPDWPLSRAGRTHAVEAALLALWQPPGPALEAAIVALWRLTGGGETAQQYPALRQAQEVYRQVPYPWTLADLSFTAQGYWADLGFARWQKNATGRPRAGQRLILAYGLLFGLAGAASGYVGLRGPAPPQVQGGGEGVLYVLAGETLTVSTPAAHQQVTVPPDGVAQIFAQTASLACTENPSPGVWVYRCGQNIPERPQNWPVRSLVWLQGADPAGLQPLVERFLDTGSADQVWVSTQLPGQYPAAFILPTDQGPVQTLLLAEDIPQLLPSEFLTVGQLSVAQARQVLAQWPVQLQGQGPDRVPWVQIGPAPESERAAPFIVAASQPQDPARVCRNERTLLDKFGIPWVPIPAGTFTMGSPESDKDADSDEKPAHPVAGGAFYMMACEFSLDDQKALSAQPRQHTAASTLPRASINWNDAQKVCERLGGRLPLEHEWEYAARAGTTTRFYWGDSDDKATLDLYAWYNGNSGHQSHPVGSKRPNYFGLYDMAGNLWEWNGDCYDEGIYQGQSQEAKGFGWPYVAKPIEVCGAVSDVRVLRGGSFVFSSDWLRSADRGMHRPVGSVLNYGFRCVRFAPPTL